MKKLVLTTLIIGALKLCGAQTTNFLFTWDNPGSGYTYMVWKLYSTTNIAIPTNQWPLVKIETAPTNISPTRLGTYLPFTNAPGQYFYTMKWSNSFWGLESFFAPVTATPLVPPLSLQFNLGLQPAQ